MRSKRSSYSTTYYTEIESDSGRSHLLKLDVEYTIGCDGIGPYEFWGEKCFDPGQEYIEEAWANHACICRERTVAKREDIPNIHGIRNIHTWKDRWVYAHIRVISPDATGVERALEDFKEVYDFKEDSVDDAF